MISLEQLEDIAIYSTDRRRMEVISPLNAAMEEFEINTPLRMAAFLAQILHESGSFKYTEEIASGAAYEYRKDLGNLEPEALAAAHKVGNTTGKFYKGRGFIQITGFYNYKACGEVLDLDLINHPELLCNIVNACRSAGWFWKEKGLNPLADDGNFSLITKRINGGFNGQEDRVTNYVRARKVLKQ